MEIVMTHQFSNHSPDSQSRSQGEIVQLRECGSERYHPLRAQALRHHLGTDKECAVRLSDPDVFPMHARLSCERRQWMLRALGDTAALWCDGARITLSSLEPGMEIRVGQTTLVAEDHSWIALRAFCARLLGWGVDRMVVVDHALRSIRMWLTHRAPLLLRGDSDMVPIAQALHRRVLGADPPFIVCDPRRGQHKATVRSAANHETATAAAHAAIGGSVCVRSWRLPPDFAMLRAWLPEPSSDVRLIICLERDQPSTMLPASIDVPPLSGRAQDLPRIIDEYAQDAIAAFDAPDTSFAPEDHRWVLAHGTTSLPEIEKATLRRVALRSTTNMSRAAARLGMAPVSLSRWLGRRSGRARAAGRTPGASGRRDQR
jgi:hypothetical protein